MNQIKIGAILSYLNIVLTNIIGLLLTPLIIKSLGSQNYGVYTLIGSMIGYFTLMDFGVGDTVIRYVSRFRAQNDQDGEARFIGTIIKIYIPITFIILLIGIFFYFNLDYFFGKKFTVAEFNLSKQLFIILLFNLCFSLIGNIFIGTINAYEKYIYSKTILITKYILRAILVYFILVQGGQALSLVIVDTVMNILFFLTNFYYFRRVLKLKITFSKIDKKHIKEIFSFSIWLFLLSMLSQFQWQGGQLLLGVISKPAIIAIYSIGIMLGGYYGAFSAAITSMFLPHATRQIVNNVSSEELTDTMIRIGRISSYILLFILTGFILYGKQFVILWIGEYYIESYYVAVIIMIVSTFPLIQSYANSILEAKQMVRYKTLIYLTFICLGVLGGFFGYRIYGVIGVACSISLGWLISIFILNIFYIKKLNLNMIKFYKELFIHQFLPLLFLSGIGYFISSFFIEISWLNLSIMIISYSLIYSITYYLFVLNKNEKEIIKKIY